MTASIQPLLGSQIELAYGRSLATHNRRPGPYAVFGSNGQVGWHDEACAEGPGIIVGRKGSVGEIVYSQNAFWPIDTTYYVVNAHGHNWRFLYYLLRHIDLTELNSHSAVPGLNREDVYSISGWFPDPTTQSVVAKALDRVDELLQVEISVLGIASKLKQTAMRELFTRGLRRELAKTTEIGPVPESWSIDRLDLHARVISTRMAYSELELAIPDEVNGIRVVGIKVSDMNREGNERELLTGALEKQLDQELVTKKCAPPGTIVFPKRGAAIATNKKRITVEWTVFDPNVIGVLPSSINAHFLFHWFQSFDLRGITEPGPTPQLNKKHLDPLLIPVPSSNEEQSEIVEILDLIDSKISLHRKRIDVLEQLFKAFLHNLMTGEIHVDQLDLSALKAA